MKAAVGIEIKLNTYMYYINGNERQPKGNKDNNNNPRIAERKDGLNGVIVVVHLRKVDFLLTLYVWLKERNGRNGTSNHNKKGL